MVADPKLLLLYHALPLRTHEARGSQSPIRTMLSLLLLSLLVVPSRAMQVHVPELPVVALQGRDTVLNCTFSGTAPFSPSDISVFWQLTDTKRSVHGYWDGRDQLVDQAEAFSGRTALSPDRLRHGDASLLLRRVEVADEGSYTCFVRVQNYSSSALLLQVAAAYSNPAVTLPPDSNLRPGDEMDLSCVSYGGYPEAEVLWQDGGGRNLTDNVTSSLVANEDGLFSVHSVLSIILVPNSTYTCRLNNPVLGDQGHMSVTITGPCQNIRSSAAWKFQTP
ncbi:CD276 antigen isoform X3 [Gadus morhua]|uniref:CD276 antigen isoform X3 n=1 Tax=Gadus morhua TaxID=8049 RepID=UPI0011B7218C|nr:CD276 antigen isoform X3 [Gadus morhua]